MKKRLIVRSINGRSLRYMPVRMNVASGYQTFTGNRTIGVNDEREIGLIYVFGN